jgi:hypothetical protein
MKWLPNDDKGIKHKNNQGKIFGEILGIEKGK